MQILNTPNSYQAVFRQFSDSFMSDTKCPPLISKKYLCIRMELVMPGGQCNYQALYRQVLTDAVLAACGLTPQQVRQRNVKTFNREQSVKLKEVLAL